MARDFNPVPPKPKLWLVAGLVIAGTVLTVALSQLEARPQPVVPGKGEVGELVRYLDDSLGVACYNLWGGTLSCVKYK